MATAEPTFTEQAAHHVALVLDNDEGLYNWRRDLVREALEESERRFAGLEEPRRSNIASSLLADSLKDWCEELADLDNDSLPILARELLTLALAWVDWRKLALDYIEEAQP